MKPLSIGKWLIFTMLAFSLAACESLSAVQTAEDGQEIRFDTVKGSIEYTEAMIIGTAKATKRARDNDTMSKATALKIKHTLGESQTNIEMAQMLVNEMRFDEAETKITASKAALNIARKLLKSANIGDTQL